MKGRHHNTTGRRDRAFLEVREVVDRAITFFFSLVAFACERLPHLRYLASDDGIHRVRQLLPQIIQDALVLIATVVFFMRL